MSVFDLVQPRPLWTQGIPGRVVHCKREPYDVYVGRPSLLGNPFFVGPDMTRGQAILAFRVYARKRMVVDPEFAVAIRACRGRTLGCWCAPKDCHAWVILQLAHEDYLNAD
jgi:hypothetical protein